MNKRKLLSMFLALTLTLSLVSPALATAFADVPAGSWYEAAVQYVSDKKIMEGTSNGFEPMGKVTRATVFQILYNMAGKPTEGVDKAAFNDIEGKWYAPAANWAGAAGIAAGEKDSAFKGDEIITRAETAATIAKYAALSNATVDTTSMAMKEASDYAAIPAEYLEGMTFCFYGKIMVGDEAGQLNPMGELTRAEMTKIMSNFDQMYPTYATEIVAIEVPEQDGIPAHTIPGILTLPAKAEGKVPAVVMLHGTGSDKNEAGGGYISAASAIAAAGVASLRIDFMGSGTSKADYANYNYTSAKIDAKAAADYLAKREDISGEALGVMGWSQGGTNALLAAAAYPDTFKAVVTWAGALDLTILFPDFKAARATAEKDGFYEMAFDWRTPLHFGKQWFKEVAATDVVKEIAKIKAPILAIHGTADTTVDPATAQKIDAAAKNPRSYVQMIDKCDHTFNVFSGNDAAIMAASASAATYLHDALSATSMQISVTVKNGTRDIPAIVTLPAGNGPFPAVVINHGHGGSKDENVGFVKVANVLGAQGIASIRMDFPGCGESKAPFTDNTMTNMSSDSNASKDYLLKNFPIDASKLGLMGYSMGGRIALEIASKSGQPYKAVVLLSASADSGLEMSTRLLGGQERYDTAYAEAQKNGFYTYTTQYGQVQTLSKAWFEDMKVSTPLKNIKNYTGPMLVLYGDKDVVVTGEINKSIVTAYPKAQEVVVPGADHGYGFYSDQPDVTAAVEGNIMGFFTLNLTGKNLSEHYVVPGAVKAAA